MNQKAVIFARTSKQSQKMERQIADLTDVANKENYTVVKVIEKKISDSTKNENWKGIESLR